MPSLRALHVAGHDVALVVTQPDRPGHRLRLTPPPVKVAAEELGLEVFQPERVRAPESVSRLAASAPELVVVVAYGQIIPRSVLEIPPRGVLNLHASLLPRHRGAAPIAHAILGGDAVTGVTIMQMDELLDHGPILAVRETAIGPHEDAAVLAERLAAMGADLLVETIARLDEIEPVEQDHAADVAAGGRTSQGAARPAAVRLGRAGAGAAVRPRRCGGGRGPWLLPAGGGAAARTAADPASGAGGAACLNSAAATSRSTGGRSTTTSSTSATRRGWC